jgi:hypothetical protein
MELVTKDSVWFPYEEVIARTARATLYKVEGEEMWLPNSVVEEDDGGEITIPLYIAVDRELVSDEEAEEMLHDWPQ